MFNLFLHEVSKVKNMNKIRIVLTLFTILLNLNLNGQNSLNEKSLELQKILDKVVDNKKIFGTSFCVKYKDQVWCCSAGNMDSNQQYFIASTTKLFVTAITLHLVSKGKLSLDDKISNYLDESILNGLHVFKEVDYSRQITIRNLLAHTSGLPDYFQNKGPNGKSLENEIMLGEDQFWTFEQAINRSKAMKPLFAPNTKGKAHYSDANFQLLGKIISTITQKSFPENCKELIIQPLNLTKTYMFVDVKDTLPKSLYYKENQLIIPKAMTSFGADGGVVSNSQEMLIFIEAFFNGKFFPKEYIADLQVWNKIFPPLQSGIGIHLFRLPKVFGMPELIGHSGLSGALAYYDPKDEIYIAGTVNQIAYPSTSFTVATKLIQTALLEPKKEKFKTVSAVGLGANYSTIYNNNGQSKVGLSLGLYKEYKVFKHISLTAELQYNQKGERSNDALSNIKLHYFDTPLMVRFNFLDDKLGLSTGISTNLLLGSNKEKNTFQRFDNSIPFAINYAMNDFLQLSLKYNIGLNDIAKNGYLNQGFHNRWFSVSILLVKP